MSLVFVAVDGGRVGRQVREVVSDQDGPQRARPASAAVHGPGREAGGGAGRHGGTRAADGRPRRTLLPAVRHGA